MIAIVGAATKGGDEWVKEIRWVGGLGIALRLNSYVGLGSPEHRHHVVSKSDPLLSSKFSA